MRIAKITFIMIAALAVAALPAAELAAMTTVARVILNMHETITRN